MSAFFKQNRVLIFAFALLLAGSLFFGWNTFQHTAHYRAASQDRSVEAWMTTRYIAHTWRLPRETMESLGFERQSDGPRPLSKIADERGVPVDTVIAEVEAAIAAHLAEMTQ